MTLQEKVKKKAEGFGKLAPVFLEGAEFALNNQWISVKDDLPCHHQEMIQSDFTDKVLILSRNGCLEVTFMCVIEGKWDWGTLTTVLYWMIAPKLPKE